MSSSEPIGRGVPAATPSNVQVVSVTAAQLDTLRRGQLERTATYLRLAACLFKEVAESNLPPGESCADDIGVHIRGVSADLDALRALGYGS